MCSSPGIPPGPRGSGPFSLPPLFIARSHRMTLGRRLVPRHALSPLAGQPAATTSRFLLPGAASRATCLLPPARPSCHTPSLPFPQQRDTAAFSPPEAGPRTHGQNVAVPPQPHTTPRTRPARSSAHAPPAAPPAARTSPRGAPHAAPHTHRHSPARHLALPSVPPPRLRPTLGRGGAGAGPRPPTRKD